MTCKATRHGDTIHYYKDHGCRCPGARAAKAAESRRWPRPPKDRSPDQAAIARACLGDRTIRLTAVERGEAIRRLTARGHSQAWIAEHLGISRRTVVRHRSVAHADIRTAA